MNDINSILGIGNQNILIKEKIKGKKEENIMNNSSNHKIFLGNGDGLTKKNIQSDNKEEGQIEHNKSKQGKITEQMIEKEIEEKNRLDKIIDDIKILMNNQVIIKKIVDFEFFIEEDFQILKKKKAHLLPFIINLQNYIKILNAILFYVENENNEISLLHSFLKLIDSKFSYGERKGEKIKDFGFLTKVSKNIYPYILARGETGFEDANLKDLASSYYQANNMNLGHLFEESNKSYLLNEIQDKNYIEYPNIIYYLNEKGVIKMFQKNIFKYPISYTLKDTKQDGNDFSGFNEIDICFKMKNDILINENNNFNIVKLPYQNVITKYNPQSKSTIQFKKDTIYFIEVKKNPNNLDEQVIFDITNRTKTFFQFYKNSVCDALKEEDGIKYENMFICNQNRDNVVQISKNKSIKMLYSDKIISLYTIASLNANIYNLNIKNDSLNKSFDLLKQEMKEVDKKMVTKDQEIKELNQKIGTKDQEIKELNQKIGTKDQEMKELNQKMRTKDQEIKELNQKMGTKDQEMKELNQKIGAKDQEMKELNQKIGAKDQEMKELNQKMVTKDQEIKELNKKTNLLFMLFFAFLCIFFISYLIKNH